MFLHHYRDIPFYLNKFDLIYRDIGFLIIAQAYYVGVHNQFSMETTSCGVSSCCPESYKHLSPNCTSCIAVEMFGFLFFKSWLVQFGDRCLCLYLDTQDSMPRELCVVIVLDPAKILSLFLGLLEPMIPLIMSAVYVWCQLNRDMVVTFWFGIPLKVNGCYAT